MALDPQVVASAAVTALERYFNAMPGGWARRQDGVLVAVTGVAFPILNGVWAEALNPDVGMVSGRLDEVAATGLPYCLQLRPGAGVALAELGASRGMERDVIPLMALEGPGSFSAAGEVDGLSIREISPEEAEVHARVLARGFEIPPEPFLQMVTPPLLSMPGVRCYLGEVGGQPVTTGLGASAGLSVGVFDIATPPEHRGRGYGAAVTVRAVVDAMEGGARWAWLQSSHEGHNLYRRLGFTDLEQWDCWVAAGEGSQGSGG